MLHEQNSPKNTWSRWLTPPVDMDKTVQKAPGADGLRRLWTWAKQCKKHLEQMAYAACGHGQTVQKAPGVDSKRRLWPCERSGGAKGFGPLQATCPPSPHLPGGLEHVRHLGPGRWLQVASAPPSHLHAPPRHTWRAGARAPPGLNSETENPSHGRAGLPNASLPAPPRAANWDCGVCERGPAAVIGGYNQCPAST